MVHCVLNKSRCKSRSRLLVFFIAGIVLSASACRSATPSDVGKKNADAIKKGTGAPLGSTAVEKEIAGYGASFRQGITTVFGIKIPTGMSPAKGPDKVYRFEGNMPLHQTAVLIRNQVIAEKELRENKGYLFRFAKPKAFRMRRDADRVLAVRVFPNARGSTLDIWLEKEYGDKLPDAASTAAYLAPKLPGVTRMRVDKNTRARQRESLSEAVRVLQKVQKGESLTEEDKKVPVFD